MRDVNTGEILFEWDKWNDLENEMKNRIENEK